MAQITLRMPDELLAELESEADEHDESRSEYIRNITFLTLLKGCFLTLLRAHSVILSRVL